MQKQGFDVHVVTSPGPLLEKLAKRDNVSTHSVPIARKCLAVRDFVTLVRLFLLLRRLRPEIVQVSTPKAALVGALASWLARVPVRVFLVRGLVTYKLTGFYGLRIRWHERLTAALCHQSIFVSRSVLDFARSSGIVSASQGIVVANGMSNGVDTQRFDPTLPGLKERSRAVAHSLDIPSGSIVIGQVGRFATAKGIEDLVEAWRIIRDEFPSVRLLLVGYWDERDIVQSAIRRNLESDSRVALSGYVEDTVPYYSIMSLLVHPSRRQEGFPNAPMEAAAMGLPVVTTDIIGCTDAVVDGLTGTIVPACNPRRLADAIRTYLKDPAVRKRHGMAGRHRVVREYRPETIWSGLSDEYRRLLSGAGFPLPDSHLPEPTQSAITGSVHGSKALKKHDLSL